MPPKHSPLDRPTGHPLVVSVSRNVSVEHRLAFCETCVSNRFVANLANRIGEHRKDRIGSAVSRIASDIGLETTRHDEDIAHSGRSSRARARLPLARRTLGRIGHVRCSFFDRPGLSMALRWKMDFPTIHRAKNQGRSRAIARRYAADPIDTAERNIILAGAATPPSFRHALPPLPRNTAAPGYDLPPGRPNQDRKFWTNPASRERRTSPGKSSRFSYLALSELF